MTSHPTPANAHHPVLIALIAASALFMEILDATAIAPAVPKIAESFQTNATAISAGISFYLITVAIFIPSSAWLTERFGARAVFAVAIAIFTIASVLCGLSENLTQFTLARVLQGIGGAMMSPVGRLEVLRRTDKTELLRVIAFLTWPGLSAFAFGPPLGGLLTTYLSWHWIFFINVPIGIAGIALVLIFFERGTGRATRRFDGLGFVLNGGALASILYSLEQIARDGVKPVAAALLAAGTMAGILALRHAGRHPAPLLPVSALKVATFRIGTLTGGGLFRVSVGATAFLLPVMFQIGFGMTAFNAGLLVFCFLMGDLAAKSFANRIARRYGFWSVLVFDGLLIFITGMGLVLLTPQTPLWLIVAVLVVAGMVRSVQFTALNSLAFADIPPEEMSNASTISSMLHSVMMGAGVTVAAMTLNATAALRASIDAELTLFDFHVALAVMALLALIAIIAYIPMDRDAGAHVTQQPSQ
jgi:EmrB/QacA subfamily drug resistance transporter